MTRRRVTDRIGEAMLLAMEWEREDRLRLYGERRHADFQSVSQQGDYQVMRRDSR